MAHFFFILLTTTLPLFAVEDCPMPVSTARCFNARAAQLSPGQTLIVKNGTYLDWGKLNVRASGTASAPIEIRPETPNGVQFKGKISISVVGSHLVLKHFHFTNAQPLYVPANNGAPLSATNFLALPLIRLSGQGASWSNSIRVTGVTFRNSGICKLDSDPTDDARPRCALLQQNSLSVPECRRLFETGNTKPYCNVIARDLPALVSFEVGVRNSRLDSGRFLQTRGTAAAGFHYTAQGFEEPTLNRIDHNDFRQNELPNRIIPNGGESIRMNYFDSSSTPNEKPSRDLVDHNLFYQCNGDSETVSAKGIGSKILFNTFIGKSTSSNSGHLSLRGGSGMEVYGNFFFHLALGVRVFGEDQRIWNNFFYNVNRAVILPTGNSQTPHNLGYQQSVRGILSHNTVLHSVTEAFNFAFANGTYPLAPSNNRVSGNLLKSNLGVLFNVKNNDQTNQLQNNDGLAVPPAVLGSSNSQDIATPTDLKDFRQAEETLRGILKAGSACVEVSSGVHQGAAVKVIAAPCLQNPDPTVNQSFINSVPETGYVLVP